MPKLTAITANRLRAIFARLRHMPTQAKRHLRRAYLDKKLRKTAYHITPKDRVESIKKHGLMSGANIHLDQTGITRPISTQSGKRVGRVFVGGINAVGALQMVSKSISKGNHPIIFGERAKGITGNTQLLKVKAKRSRLQRDLKMLPFNAWEVTQPGTHSKVLRDRRVVQIPRKNIRETSFKKEYGKRAAVGSVVAGSAYIGKNKYENKVRRVKK